MTELQDRINRLYEKLVPDEGKCDTVEGEMIRAICKIWYRYNNDGDYYWKGYGTETAGPAHSYLVNECPIRDQLSLLFKEYEDEAYEKSLDNVIEAIATYIENKNGNYEPNTVDMLDCEPMYDNDDNYYEEEEDW